MKNLGVLEKIEPMSGRELHFVMQDYGIKQRELGAKVGRSQSTVSKLFDVEEVPTQYIRALEQIMSAPYLANARQKYKEGK